jgi:hypothetical protein
MEDEFRLPYLLPTSTDRIIPIIEPNYNYGWTCQILDLCFDIPAETLTQTNFILKADALHEQGTDEFDSCAELNYHTISYWNGSSYIKITSLTPIKLITGKNPIGNSGINPYYSCNLDTPAQWTLKITDNNLDCSTVVIQDSVSNSFSTYVKTVSIDVDNGSCQQEIDYSGEIMVVAWIFALWLAIKVALLLKNR